MVEERRAACAEEAGEVVRDLLYNFSPRNPKKFYLFVDYIYICTLER
jgi:hypothetical protein